MIDCWVEALLASQFVCILPPCRIETETQAWTTRLQDHQEATGIPREYRFSNTVIGAEKDGIPRHLFAIPVGEAWHLRSFDKPDRKLADPKRHTSTIPHR